MPFNPETKLFFIHIPKTGGSSIERALDMSLMNKKEGTRYCNCSPQHTPISLLQYELPNPHLFEYFTVVRCPYTRIVSEFLWRRSIEGIQIETKTVAQDFNHFLKYVFKTISKSERVACFDRHIEPQNEFIINNIQIPVSVFKLENLTSLEMWLSIKLKQNIKIPHVHKTNYNQDVLQLLLNKTNRKLIRDFYIQDFEMFKYEI